MVATLAAPLSFVQADEYYVSLSGSDTNSGRDQSAPWRTIAHAARSVQPGDTVRIKGGTYEGDSLSIEKVATQERPIVFAGHEGAPVITNRTGKGIHVLNWEHVRISGITVAHCSDNGVKVHNSRYCTLDNIIVRDCHKRGQVLYVRDSDHNMLQDCRIVQTSVNPDYYLILAYSHYNTVKRCLSEHAVGFDVGHQTHGIGIKDYTGQSSDPASHSHHNVFVDCTAVNHGECFYAARPCHDNEFINCVADNSGGKQSFSPCFQVRDGAYNNTFRNCRGKGTNVGVRVYDYVEKDNTGREFQTQRSNRFVNCILQGAGRSMIGVLLRRAENTLFRNCIFQDCGYVFRFGTDGETGESGGVVGTEMRNCIFLRNGEEYDLRPLGEPYRHGKGVRAYQGAVRIGYSCFSSNGFRAPGGEGVIEADPRLDRDGHLLAGSPCVDAGSNEGIVDGETDFEGDPRIVNTRVDMGADEYRSP